MKTLFIVNHPPYGTEHAFNALRLANALAGKEKQTVKILLQGDAGAFPSGPLPGFGENSLPLPWALHSGWVEFRGALPSPSSGTGEESAPAFTYP